MVKPERLEGDIEAWNSELTKVILPNTVILVVYLVTGLIGNGITILVYQRIMKLTDDRFFIPILAVVDLLAAVFCSSLEIIQQQWQVTFYNTNICKLLAFTNTLFTLISASLLCSIAVQRYVKFFCSKSSQMSKTRIYIALFISCTFSLSLSIPQIFSYGSVDIKHPEFNLTGKRCGIIQEGENLGYTIYGIVMALVLISILSLLVFVYSKIGYKVFMHFHQTKSSLNPKRTSEDMKTEVTTLEDRTSGESSEQQDENNKHVKVDKQIVKLKYRLALMFMVITILFLVCFTPPVIMTMILGENDVFWEDLPDGTIVVLTFLNQLYILNSVINPVIYAFMDTQFREGCKRVFTCK